MNHKALPSSALHASPFLEPEEAEDPANAHLLLEDLGDGHACVDELLSSLITDAGHERGRFADQSQLLSRDGGRDKRDVVFGDFPRMSPLSVPGTSVLGLNYWQPSNNSQSPPEKEAQSPLIRSLGARK